MPRFAEMAGEDIFRFVGRIVAQNSELQHLSTLYWLELDPTAVTAKAHPLASTTPVGNVSEREESLPTQLDAHMIERVV